jgi:hypothetical protein
MKPLNHCRQMVKQFSQSLSDPNFPEENRNDLSYPIFLSKESIKFILPEGGRLYDDPEYRSMNENELLHLPYPVIALEYTRRRDGLLREDQLLCSKTILFAKEIGESILLLMVAWSDCHGIWVPFPMIVMPRIGYLDRSNVMDGRVAITARAPIPKNRGVGERMSVQEYKTALIDDYSDEIGAFLCFLNILQCNNVRTESIQSKYTRSKNGGKIDAAFPFDTYHILTIDSAPSKSGSDSASGSHRSPREHLRRGHIRRLSGDRRIWVNSTIVAAGRGAGTVKKEYVMQNNA